MKDSVQYQLSIQTINKRARWTQIFVLSWVPPNQRVFNCDRGKEDDHILPFSYHWSSTGTIYIHLFLTIGQVPHILTFLLPLVKYHIQIHQSKIYEFIVQCLLHIFFIYFYIYCGLFMFSFWMALCRQQSDS